MARRSRGEVDAIGWEVGDAVDGKDVFRLRKEIEGGKEVSKDDKRLVGGALDELALTESIAVDVVDDDDDTVVVDGW